MSTDTVSPLRQRMIEDMNARKLCAGTQTGHIRSCKRFAAFLKRSPDTATLEDIRRFQLHLAETGVSICTRNRIMTGLRFLFRVTLRRLDLAAEIYHLREPQKIPLVMSPDETKRLLAVASSLKARILLSLGYGCGLRAGEVVYAKEPFAGPRASVAIFVALHPPRRDLQSPAAVRRPEQRHLQVQGLSDRGGRPGQDDDAGDRRVHPALPDPCPAERLPVASDTMPRHGAIEIAARKLFRCPFGVTEAFGRHQKKHIGGTTADILALTAVALRPQRRLAFSHVAQLAAIASAFQFHDIPRTSVLTQLIRSPEAILAKLPAGFGSPSSHRNSRRRIPKPRLRMRHRSELDRDAGRACRMSA